MAKSIQPLGDRVLLEVVEQKESSRSGIIIPDSSSKNAKLGKVIAVGPGRRTDEGKEIPMTIAVGDTVVFSWGEEVSMDGNHYHIVNESSIMGTVK